MNTSTADKINEELSIRCKILVGDDAKARAIYFRGVEDCRTLMLEAIQKTFPAMPYPERGQAKQPAISADEIEELAHKYFSPMKNKQGEEYQQLVGQNPNGWRKHVRSFTAGYKAGAKAMQEYADLQTAALREENTRLKAEKAELREGLKWIPIENEEAFCNALKKYDILLLYDNGQIRRLGEAGQPFAINTHFLELPDIPESILSKYKL